MTTDPKQIELETDEPGNDEDAHEHGVVLHQREAAASTSNEPSEELDETILGGLVSP